MVGPDFESAVVRVAFFHPGNGKLVGAVPVDIDQLCIAQSRAEYLPMLVFGTRFAVRIDALFAGGEIGFFYLIGQSGVRGFVPR